MQLRHTHLKSSFNGFAFTVLVCRGCCGVVVRCGGGEGGNCYVIMRAIVRQQLSVECGKLFSSYFFPPLRDRKTFLLSFRSTSTRNSYHIFFLCSFCFFTHNNIHLGKHGRAWSTRDTTSCPTRVSNHCPLLTWQASSCKMEMKQWMMKLRRRMMWKIFCFYLHTSSRSVCSHVYDPCCSRFSSLLKSCERVLILFAWKSHERERDGERGKCLDGGRGEMGRMWGCRMLLQD